MPALRLNTLSAKLASQPYLVGTFVELHTPQTMELLGLAGFDFAIIDCEHNAFPSALVEDMIRAAATTDLVPIVRVAECNATQIRLPLDSGAAGVQIPQVESAAMAAAAAKAARFHPRGERGMHPYVRSASYRAYPTAEYLPQVNQDVSVIVHIEGNGGVAEMRDIIHTPGIDVAFLGPYDLSQALGVPGQVNDPRITRLIEEAVAMAPAGTVIGTYADSPEGVKRWAAAGVRYLTVGIDVGFLLSHAREIVQAAK